MMRRVAAPGIGRSLFGDILPLDRPSRFEAKSIPFDAARTVLQWLYAMFARSAICSPVALATTLRISRAEAGLAIMPTVGATVPSDMSRLEASNLAGPYRP